MIHVLKFGGTSLGTSERIQTIVEIIQARARKRRLVAVFSAMGGVTNQIIQAMETAEREGLFSSTFIDALKERHLLALQALADTENYETAQREIEHWLEVLQRKLSGMAILRECSPKTAAVVSSIGERLSLPILSAALRSAGLSVTELDATGLIRTNRDHLDAQVDLQASEYKIRAKLAQIPQHNISVVNGFIGAAENGETTTLGRSGSDYTASIFGSAVDAELVEIWTDVNGVLSADPSVIHNPVSLTGISYREASEMAFFGTKVLHPKTMHPLEAKGIPLVIRNTFQPDHPGTRIEAKASGSTEQSGVKAISAVGQVALITIAQDARQNARLTPALLNALATLQNHIISANFSISEATVSLAVHAAHGEDLVHRLKKVLFSEEQPCQKIEITLEKDLSLLAVVGQPEGLQNGNLNRIFETFSRHNITTRSVGSGASNHSLTVILPSRDLERAMRALHDIYFSRPESLTAQLLAAACA